MILSGSSSVPPSHCSAVHVYRNYRAAVQGHIEEKNKKKHAHTKKGAVMWRGVRHSHCVPVNYGPGGRAGGRQKGKEEGGRGRGGGCIDGEQTGVEKLVQMSHKRRSDAASVISVPRNASTGSPACGRAFRSGESSGSGRHFRSSLDCPGFSSQK